MLWKFMGCAQIRKQRLTAPVNHKLKIFAFNATQKFLLYTGKSYRKLALII